MKKYIIGLDLGGTKISCAVADLKGEIVKQYTIPTLANLGEEKVMNRIISVIDKIIKESKININEIQAIGVGAPGPLDIKNGIIITTPNLPFKNFNIIKPIKNRYNTPTYIDNDANVATIGEYIFGAGKGTENMIFVTVSTGIGGGAILNGNIYRGNTSNALEIGHMTLMPNGPKCNCGNCGCVEALASGTSIAKQANEAVLKGEYTSLSKFENITSVEVFKEARNGDKIAKKIVNNSLTYLGICIANLVTIFDPEIIVIGGGVSKAGDIVFDEVRKEVNKRCFSIIAKACNIVPALLGGDAGIKGAIALALMENK